MKIYLAYGSNLNVAQMAIRCPSAKVAGYGFLRDTRLLFKGSKTGAYLTIEPYRGENVPVGAWRVSKADEAALDRYEGFPKFYRKVTTTIALTGTDGVTRQTKAFYYTMRHGAQPGLPSEWYYDVCRRGYYDFGFDEKTLFDAVSATRKAMEYETR